jgi:septal ring factor EnvC (AmiA/AmiB activator)
VSKEYVPASHSTSLRAPAAEKKVRKRRRNSFFPGLFPAKDMVETKGKRSVLPVVLAVLLWGGLAYGGYVYANHTLEMHQRHIDQRIQEVQAFNQKQMEQLQGQLVLVEEEMKRVQDGLTSIEEELQLTGETIGGTNETKQALQVRIDQLNKQLIELKASLKKLEDAARAW